MKVQSFAPVYWEESFSIWSVKLPPPQQLKTIKILDENIFEYKLYFSESAQEKGFDFLTRHIH